MKKAIRKERRNVRIASKIKEVTMGVHQLTSLIASRRPTLKMEL
jgi:hypothetical protein